LEQVAVSACRFLLPPGGGLSPPPPGGPMFPPDPTLMPSGPLAAGSATTDVL